MAENLLKSLAGFQYQPYEAQGAILDPAAELGDAITVNGVYSGIYKRDTDFDALTVSDISAPQEEALDYEVPHLTLTNRELTRQVLSTKSEFKIQADQISAKVNKEGGAASSFGWSLKDDSWVVYSGSKAVLTATKNGLSVQGEIRATSGYIGSDSNGFTIGSKSIYNGVLSMSDTEHKGIYLGTDGIVLGKGAFKVDSNGNLTAKSGTFTGTVHAGKIAYGGNAGYFSGQGLSSGSVRGGYGGQIGSNTITTVNTNSGINTSLGYADYAYGCLKGWNTITALHAASLDTNDFTIEGHQIDRATIRYQNSSGMTSTANVLVWY